MKLQLRLLLFCVISAPNVLFAQLQNTGWKVPTGTHFPNDWTAPQKAFVSDDSYAEALHQSGCRCPFMDLSWDEGINFSTDNIFGPYGTVDSYRTQGDSTDGWGHTWIDSELSDTNFLLRIWNSSTLLKQGFTNFGFGIPSGSTISGIEVQVEAHGDSGYTMDLVDVIEARVYYYLPTAVNEVYGEGREVNVFPNPAHGLLHFRFAKNAAEQKIQLINVQGELLMEKVFSEPVCGSDCTMDISRLAGGIYFLNMITNERTVNARIIVE